jgi:YD repeat-containing protein
LVSAIKNRNSKTFIQYERVRKLVKNRGGGDGFSDTYRVTQTSDAQRVYNPQNPNDIQYAAQTHITTYNYGVDNCYYSDETAYAKRYTSRFLNPSKGSYKTRVTSPTGAITTYEFKASLFHPGRRAIMTLTMPFLDNETVKASSALNADSITKTYTYGDPDALTSPTKIVIAEKIDNVERRYVHKIEYEDNTCFPSKTSLPMPEAEGNQPGIPATKSIITYYTDVGNATFLPSGKAYYQDIDGAMLTESIHYDALGRVDYTTNAKGEVVHYSAYDTVYKWLPKEISFTDPENIGDNTRVIRIINEYADAIGIGATRVKTQYGNGSFAEKWFDYEIMYGAVMNVWDELDTRTTYFINALGRHYETRYANYTGKFGERWLTEIYTYANATYNSDNRLYFAANKYTLSLPSANAQDQSSNPITQYGVAVDSVFCDDYGEVYATETNVGKEEYIHDGANRVTGHRDQRDFGTAQLTSSVVYDGFNRIKSATDRAGNVSQVTFKSLSNEYTFIPAGTTTPENHYTANYDIFGNVSNTKTYPNGIASGAITNSYTYDLLGNVKTYTDGGNKITQYQYDALGNAIQTTRADSSVIKSDYTKWGTPKNITQYDNGMAYTISKGYDDRGQVISTEPG